MINEIFILALLIGFCVYKFAEYKTRVEMNDLQITVNEQQIRMQIESNKAQKIAAEREFIEYENEREHLE